MRGFSTRAAQRLHAHTGGNALYVKTMLAELPEKRWRTWNPSLPAPRAFASQVLRRLEAASPPTRGLVEAVAVLGTTAPVGAAATLAGVPDLFAALDEASVVGLLQVREDFGIREVGFPHPLVQAAVYEQLGPLRRMQLHSAAAEFVEDEGALLRHRVLAATPPNTELAAELEAFARREAAVGAWASAAWALVEAATSAPTGRRGSSACCSPSTPRSARATCTRPRPSPGTSPSFSRGAWRDAALGYLAILRGRRDEAEELLGHAWRLSADDPDTSVAAVVAQRLAPARRRTAARRRGGALVHAGRSSWPDPATPCASRPRRCSGWAWAGRGRSPRAWRPTRSCWAGSTRPRTARSWSASAWRTAGCGWWATTSPGHARRWR